MICGVLKTFLEVSEVVDVKGIFSMNWFGKEFETTCHGFLDQLCFTYFRNVMKISLQFRDQTRGIGFY